MADPLRPGEVTSPWWVHQTLRASFLPPRSFGIIDDICMVSCAVIHEQIRQAGVMKFWNEVKQ